MRIVFLVIMKRRGRKESLGKRDIPRSTLRAAFALQAHCAPSMSETSTYDHGQLALPLSRRTHRDPNVLPEGGQEPHQPLDGEGTGPSAHERGDVGLPDPEDLAGLGLREAALPDEAVDLQRQIGLELLALGMGESEITEDVAAALLHADSTAGLVHLSPCLSR